MPTVGFVGLGNIGAPMAGWLPKRFETYVYDLRAEATAPLVDLGCKVAESCADLATRCDVIGVCVVDDASTKAVIAGDDGLLSAAKPGSVIAIHGTIRPQTAIDLAERGRERAVDVIDAQITGGAAGAKAGTLTSIVGGNAEAVERARPYMECFSSQITLCGEVGAGAVAKICNNVVVYQVYMALTEAIDLAAKNGIDQDKLVEVLSWMPDRSLTMLGPRRMLRAEPDHPALRPGLEAAYGLSQKDLGLALELAASDVDGGLEVPGTEICRKQMRRIYGLPEE